jgi:hypothetical protein
MYEIWVEYNNGTVECVDNADSKHDAQYMVSEYRMAFNNCVVRVWMQRSR